MVTPGAADGLRWTPRRAQGPAATVTQKGGMVSKLRRTSRRTPQQGAPAACAKQASTCDNLWPTVPKSNLEGGEEGRTRPQKRKGGGGGRGPQWRAAHGIHNSKPRSSATFCSSSMPSTCSPMSPT